MQFRLSKWVKFVRYYRNAYFTGSPDQMPTIKYRSINKFQFVTLRTIMRHNIFYERV